LILRYPPKRLKDWNEASKPCKISAAGELNAGLPETLDKVPNLPTIYRAVRHF
jgi:hypothetical protein